MIHRQVNRKRWYRTAPEPVDDTRLSWQAKGLLVYLLSKHDDWEVSIQQLVSATPDGITVVRSCLKELQEFGYAKLLQARNAGSSRADGKRWEIFETPAVSTSAAPVSEKPLTSRKPVRQKTCTSENLTVRKPDPILVLEETYDLEEEPKKNILPILPPKAVRKSSGKKSYSPGFQRFYSGDSPQYAGYPKKVSPDDAWRAWQKLQLESLTDTIIAGVQRNLAQNPSWRTNWRGEVFIPNPATFLNRGDWKSEFGTAVATPPRHGVVL